MSKKHRNQDQQQGQPKKSNNRPYIAGGVFVVALLVVYFVGKNMQTEKLEPAVPSAGKFQIRPPSDAFRQ